jgi:hypothetical protein
MIHYLKWTHELGITILMIKMMVYLMEMIMTLLMMMILTFKSY